MEDQTFTIPNIACGHCVAAINEKLQKINGVVRVGGDPQTKSLTVAWQLPATASDIEARLAEIGYPVHGIVLKSLTQTGFSTQGK